MQTNSVHFDVSLEPNAMFSVPDAAAVRFAVQAGWVWITLDGDSRDYVLAAGETLHSRDHRRALIYAPKGARVGVDRAAPALAGSAQARPRAAQRRPFATLQGAWKRAVAAWRRGSADCASATVVMRA